MQPKVELDPSSEKRNKRIFGFLSSHLNKAKQQLAKERDTDFVSPVSYVAARSISCWHFRTLTTVLLRGFLQVAANSRRPYRPYGGIV